jgi:hypothetical protein
MINYSNLFLSAMLNNFNLTNTNVTNGDRDSAAKYWYILDIYYCIYYIFSNQNGNQTFNVRESIRKMGDEHLAVPSVGVDRRITRVWPISTIIKCQSSTFAPQSWIISSWQTSWSLCPKGYVQPMGVLWLMSIEKYHTDNKSYRTGFV